MVKLVLTTFVLLFVLSAQAQTVATQPAVAISEITRLRASNAALKQSLIATQFEQMKKAYDEAVAKAKADFQSATSDLKVAVDAAFKEAGKDPDKFEFNPITGEFTSKPSASTETK